jgi:uncharacterized protein YndB with AHSA1/START domain
MPDMKELTLSVLIKRPIDVVFDFLIDPNHSPDWIDSFKRETASPWPPRLGTRYRNTDLSGERHEYKVESFTPPSVFGLVSSDATYHVEYVLTSLAAKSTQLNYREWVVVNELGDPFTAEALGKLKAILESSH